MPFSLLLILLVEMQAAPPVLVHTLCLCLLVGRLAHAFGVSRLEENYRYRVFRMVLTFTTLVASAVYLIFTYAHYRGTDPGHQRLQTEGNELLEQPDKAGD